jgi:hypothetical protein
MCMMLTSAPDVYIHMHTCSYAMPTKLLKYFSSPVTTTHDATQTADDTALLLPLHPTK